MSDIFQVSARDHTGKAMVWTIPRSDFEPELSGQEVIDAIRILVEEETIEKTGKRPFVVLVSIPGKKNEQHIDPTINA